MPYKSHLEWPSHSVFKGVVFVQRVYPSPSRRRMDSKGDCEEITFPKIYFAIDDFEQVCVNGFVDRL